MRRVRRWSSIIRRPMLERYNEVVADSDVIIHGYLKKLGGPFTSAWQTKYGKLYPSRLELYQEHLGGKPELIFMDQIDEVAADLQSIKGENTIVVKLKEGQIKETRLLLTTQVCCMGA